MNIGKQKPSALPLHVMGITIMAVLLTSCGSSSDPQAQQPSLSGTIGSTGPTYTTYGSGTSPTPTPNPGNLGPPETFAFTNLTGSGGTNAVFTSPQITTTTKLQVRVDAGPAGNISISSGQYSNFQAVYGCVTYNVTVLGQTVQTQTLSVSGVNSSNCPGAPTSQIIDFSSRLGSGHGNVTVQVQAGQYDFYCNLAETGWIYYSFADYCPLHSVYQTHTLTGAIDVVVNGTSF